MRYIRRETRKNVLIQQQLCLPSTKYVLQQKDEKQAWFHPFSYDSK